MKMCAHRQKKGNRSHHEESDALDIRPYRSHKNPSTKRICSLKWWHRQMFVKKSVWKMRRNGWNKKWSKYVPFLWEYLSIFETRKVDETSAKAGKNLIRRNKTTALYNQKYFACCVVSKANIAQNMYTLRSVYVFELSIVSEFIYEIFFGTASNSFRAAQAHSNGGLLPVPNHPPPRKRCTRARVRQLACNFTCNACVCGEFLNDSRYLRHVHDGNILSFFYAKGK